MVAGSAPAADAEADGPPRGRRGGGGMGGGGISGLALTKDGRTLYFQEGGSVYSTGVNIPQGGGAGGAGGGGRGGMAGGGGTRGAMAAATTPAEPAAGGGGARKKVTFNVTLESRQAQASGARCSTTPGGP